MQRSVEALLKIDSRVIYLLVFIVVAVAVLTTLGLPVRVTPMTQAVYDVVEALPQDAVVWVGVEYSAGSKAELDPQLTAFLHHVFKRGLKVILYSMWTLGGEIGQEIAEPIAAQYGRNYGTDWVNLGYKVGGDTNLRLCTSSIKECSGGVDHKGESIDKYPLLQQVKALDKGQVDFIMVFQTGTPGAPAYLALVTSEKGIPMGIGELQMSVPESMPYVQSGQYSGMIPGVRGAAEYERLIGVPGKAVKSADGQSLAALLVAILVILGNIGYLATRRAG